MKRLPAVLMLLLLAAAMPPAAAEDTAELDARLDLLARKDSAERLAAYARNLYEALVERGFGHNEAVQLVAAFAGSGTSAVNCRSPR